MRSATVILACGMLTAIPLSTALAQGVCRIGFVWREAFPGDTVCVAPQVRDQAHQDNAEAAARLEPGGGASGPETCREGFVWREARVGDAVCVPPVTRDQAKADNAAAASRVATSQPPPGPPLEAHYRTSDWSNWGRVNGAQYRYRIGWDPQNPRFAQTIDVTFEIHNTQGEAWNGAVRSLDCTHDTIDISKDVSLGANQTREASFPTRNCGTLAQPSFRPDVVRSVRFD